MRTAARLLLLVLLIPASASAAERQAPQVGKLCRKVVRSGEMWTLPRESDRTGRFYLAVKHLSCRKARKLVADFIEDGVRGFPRDRPRTAWNCRITYSIFTGREARCKRYADDEVKLIEFRPRYRFRVDIGVVKQYQCGAEARPVVEADRNYTLETDYGGPGGYVFEPPYKTNIESWEEPWVYDEPGTYTITVTIEDRNGHIDRDKQDVTVRDGDDVPCGSG